ncbi:MAG: 3-oxoacyl-[acyl-carrier-protein] reductase [Solidesulfovibrio sp.]
MRTALVTGGSRGIGAAVAARLARDGFDIVLTYVSKPEAAATVVGAITAAGGSARALALDTGEPAAVAAFFAEHLKDADLHVLVNNAGITRDGLLVRMKDEEFASVIRVNLIGAFTCMREAGKIMMKRRAGRIISIASVVGQAGNAGQANYAAAKAGLIGLTKSVALELAPRGVTANAVAPGFVETDMTAVLADAVKASFSDRIPLKRACAPEEIAAAVSYLASDEAGYVTGQVLGINGGMYM